MLTTYDCEIEQITQSVFATMLNLDVVRVEDSAPTEQETFTATIQVTGTWVGCIALSLSPTALRAATAAMFKLPLAKVTRADEEEVAAELVNMIGGNLKSCLPAPSSLSLPTVVSGQDFDLRISGAQLTDNVLLGSEVGSLRVRVYTKTA